jgi:sugar fermentation stimulation protein A
MVAAGHRAVLVFCVQRGDVDRVRPADHIDPVYGRACAKPWPPASR